MEIVVTTFVVTYDLINQKDRQTLWNELKRLSAHRAFESVWLLNLDSSAKEIHDHLKTFFDGDDRLWVSEHTSKRHYSNAKAGTNDWLEKNPQTR